MALQRSRVPRRVDLSCYLSHGTDAKRVRLGSVRQTVRLCGVTAPKPDWMIDAHDSCPAGLPSDNVLYHAVLSSGQGTDYGTVKPSDTSAIVT
jgi:hypothetical protein